MSTPFIQLEGIKKMYDDGYVACSNINMSIEKGKFVTLLGPSGCGKTTILKMIAGFEMPTEGKILVNGIDVKDVPIHMRPTATVFQDYALFPNMTIYENIIYGLKIMRTKLDNVDPKVYAELENVRKEAFDKATAKIKELRIKQVKIDKDILKAKLAYSKNEEIFKIQDMRYQQFQTQIYHWEKQIQKKDPEYTGFKISRENKNRILRNKFRRFFGINRFIKFKTAGLTTQEKNIYNLIKLYTYKQPIDEKVDKLIAKYNDADQWISYWENYPQRVVEAYEKQNTTRLLTKEEIKKAAKDAIELVGLTGNENKYPAELSGGMQQRVALARAIVIKPEILLLDEPLSALDAKVRKKMQEELKRIHNELKINFILVTHDQEEALRLSDQIIVMSKGKIEQFGSAKNIYEHPANAWVANFIGLANFIPCSYVSKDTIKIGDKELNYPVSASLEPKLIQLVDFKLLVRPEDVEVCPAEEAYLMMQVQQVLYKGTMYEVTCVSKDKKLTIKLESLNSLKVNETIGIKWNLKYTTPILPEKKKEVK